MTDGSKLAENVVRYCAQNLPEAEFHVLGMVNTISIGSTHRTMMLTEVLKKMAKKAVNKTAKQLQDLGIKKLHKHVLTGVPIMLLGLGITTLIIIVCPVLPF